MFSHLAAGLDGSTGSEGALELSLDLAQRLGSVVHGIHVLDIAFLEGSFIADVSGAMGIEPLINLTPQVESLLADLGATIRQHFEDRCREAGVRFEFHAVRGPVAPTLATEAAGSALLVVGKRGVNAEAHGELPGSVTERLLRISRTPVVVTPEGPDPVQRVLVGYDGSERARRALRWGGELARSLGAPVSVVSVAQEADAAVRTVAEAVEYLEPLGLEVRRHAASGHAPLVLEHFAEEDQATLVCVGSHGRHRLLEMMIGSTTEAVVRRSPIPVLCVP
ncbi:MAG TPA: universal stress protein [Acidobacteria bacterium]|nr:universal stress protein [Acidobacteriota bacterium]